MPAGPEIFGTSDRYRPISDPVFEATLHRFRHPAPPGITPLRGGDECPLGGGARLSFVQLLVLLRARCSGTVGSGRPAGGLPEMVAWDEIRGGEAGECWMYSLDLHC